MGSWKLKWELKVKLINLEEDYQAPEVLYGAIYDGVKADVFSLGVILFIMYKG